MHTRGHTLSTARRGTRPGFTLVELLIVIGIIAVLIGILLPTVGKVRIAGQKVATQNTLNRISQGIEAYFQDFGNYPGPFSDDQLVSSTILAVPTPQLGTTGIFLQYPPDPALPNVKTNLGHAPTTSENLFLGLCGGLVVNTTGGVTTFSYDPARAKRGIGPAGLNPAIAKKSQTYLELTDADISASDDNRNPLTPEISSSNPASATLSPSLWWGGAPNGPMLVAPFVGDSQIYEFMDRFAKPKPILYLRAQRGVTRVNAATTDRTAFIFDPALGLPPAANPTNPWQYRPDQIQYSYSNVGFDRDKMNGAGYAWTADRVDYPDVMDDANPSLKKFKQGNERYFVNETLSTGNPTELNDGAKVLVPAYKDKYILISAGPDGLYGTADDIRN